MPLLLVDISGNYQVFRVKVLPLLTVAVLAESADDL